jgi:hypothetical protein
MILLGGFVTQQRDGDAEQAGGTPRHAAPEGAGRHPLIDLTRDPTPGKADHAAPSEDEEE